MLLNGQLTHDSVEAYWRDIKDCEPLSRKKEVELAKQAKQGNDDAKNELVRANLRFVVSIAKEYQNYGLSMNELISEGNWGLLVAVRRFDETRGFKFITYAVWWIRQAILKALSEQRRVARPPMSQVNDLHKVEKKARALAQKLGRSPTVEELTEQAGISTDRVRNTFDLAQRDIFLDMPLYPDEEEPVISSLSDPEQDIEEDLGTQELARVLRECMDDLLDKRDKQILRFYFGLDGQQPMTLEEIGSVLGITRERVRQVRNIALKKLRAKYSDVLMAL